MENSDQNERQDEEDEMTMEDCWNVCWLDSERCVAHKRPRRRIGTQNCTNNPYCIHQLGLEKFDKLLKTQLTRKALTRRDTSRQPCGLNNAGNFCYVNSFLQIWFNDLKFRQCVYNWRPSTDWTMPTNAKLNIQFIKLLSLDNQQQDVQEFNTLFFGTIERTLEAHPNGRPVLDMIRQLFQSRIRQTIFCARCRWRSETVGEYRSLQIGIDGHNSLVSAIRSFFEFEERLGDYRCEQCRESGYVTRSSNFIQFPELLVVQLNRYVFSSDGSLRKLQNAVHYPRVLTADELLLVFGGFPDYELCAVMIHLGNSTNSGHYYDIIRDPLIGRWFTFDDETVRPRLTTPGYVDWDQKPRASVDTTGCYALIYRRIGSALGLPLQLPQAKQLEVHDGHSSFERPENISFLPLTLLTDLLTKELNAVEECQSVSATYKPSRVANVTFQLCEHGRVMPGPIIRGDIKAVNSTAAQRLIREFNVDMNLYTSADICVNCCARLRDHENTRNVRAGDIFYYPEGAYVFIKMKGDQNDDSTKSKTNAGKGTRRTVAKGLMKIRICSYETISALKLRIYEKTAQSPVDQVLYMNGETLDENLTLETAQIPANNDDNPLTLIVRQRREGSDDDDGDQKAGPSGGGGFRDTALS